MKKLIFLLLLFINTLVFSQKITTNVVSLLDDKSSLLFRTDVFEFKETFIIWTSEDGMYMYNINNYTKIDDGIYLINCVNEGKLSSFFVNFNNHSIKVNDDLIFVNSSKL